VEVEVGMAPKRSNRSAWGAVAYTGVGSTLGASFSTFLVLDGGFPSPFFFSSAYFFLSFLAFFFLSSSSESSQASSSSESAATSSSSELDSTGFFDFLLALVVGAVVVALAPDFYQGS
jgi:Na+/H+ antiporter NhaC